MKNKLTLNPWRFVKTILHRISRRLGLGLLVLMLATAASCDGPRNQPADFPFTGTVFDDDTKEPIEGAFAIAVYEIVRSGLAATARRCVKTKGMFTGKDGRFSFPVEKRDGNSPSRVLAIKTGFYDYRGTQVPPDVYRKQTREAYTDRHIYLKKQDPKDPKYVYGFSRCEEPESEAAIEAAVKFMEIKIAEGKRLGLPTWQTGATEDLIKTMKLDAQQEASRK